MAHDLIHKTKGVMTDALIDKMLLDLNLIWRDRERKQIARLKNRYNAEVMGLRRQATMSVPYNAADANKRIARLRTDLKCAYKEIKKNICGNERAKVNPSATEVIDESLKMAHAIQFQKKALNDENERLKKKVGVLESLVNAEDVEREKYMEGAAWMAKLLSEETDKYISTVENLCEEYRKRKREKEARGEADPVYLGTVHGWLIDQVESASNDFKLRVHAIKSNADYQAEGLRSRIKRATGRTGRGMLRLANVM